MAGFNLRSLYDSATEKLNEYSFSKDKNKSSDVKDNQNEPIKVTKEMYLKAFDAFEKKGLDAKLDKIWSGVGIAMGIAGGLAGAGTIAGAVGVTSITGLTSIASMVGITAVAATPVGWAIGAAAAGGAIGGGIVALKGHLTRQNERSKMLAENIKERIDQFKREEQSASENDRVKILSNILKSTVHQNKLPEVVLKTIIVGFKEKTLSSSAALALMEQYWEKLDIDTLKDSFNIDNKLFEARNLLKEAYLQKKVTKDTGFKVLNALENENIKYEQVENLVQKLDKMCGRS